MRMLIVAAIALALVAVFISTEAAGILVVGWTVFLARVLPAASADGASVALGLGALVLFAAGVHGIGRSWRNGRAPTDGSRWTIRSTAAIVIGVVVLFAAGISVIGIVHQTGWLLADDRPLLEEGLSRREMPGIHLKQMGLAVGNYASNFDQLPPSGTFDSGGGPLHSWETHLLPNLGYSTHEVNLTRAWNDPANERFFKGPMRWFINPEYRTPALQDADGFGLSHYAANQRVMMPNRSMRMDEITDGPANTILIGEVNARFKPWGHPVNSRDPAVGVNRSPTGFGGPPGTGGASFILADGSVRFVSETTDPAVLRALATPQGGEPP